MSQHYLKVFAFLIVFSQVRGTKWLIDNPGFDNTNAWESEYLPCALEQVVFPEVYSAVLPLPAKVNVGGFTLPREGAILLSDESTITLGGEMTDRDCENGDSRRAYLKTPETRKWFDPRSWRGAPAQSENTAVPQMERVPCHNETVVISRAGPLSIDLENVPYLRMGHLNLAGSLISSNYLKYLIGTNIGQMLFKNSLYAMVQYFHQDACGCHKDYSEFVEPICHNVVQTCERPHCLVPVTPLESCCPICGAVLRFAMEYCSDGNFKTLRKLIASSIKEQELTDELDYHVAYVNSPPFGDFLQAVIVDRDTYSEQSVKFLQRLNASTDWKKIIYSHHQFEVQYAGRPYNPNITFGSVLLIILCLMFVVVVSLVIFAHYAPDHRYLRYVPQCIYDPRRWRAFLLRSSFVFARFDNTAGTGAEPGGAQEGIVVGYDAESGQVRERAFDNPMFGENLKGSSGATTSSAARTTKATVSSAPKVAVVETARGKEQKVIMKSSGSKLENVTLVDDMEGEEVEEEQELAEIKLEDSTDEDSADERETKE